MGPESTFAFSRSLSFPLQRLAKRDEGVFLRRLQGSCSPGPFWEVAMRKHRWSTYWNITICSSLQFIYTWIQLVNWSLLRDSPFDATICGEQGWQYLPKRIPCGILKAISQIQNIDFPTSSIPRLSNSSMNTWSECTSTEDRCPDTNEEWSGFKCLFWKHSTWNGRHQLQVFAFFAPITEYLMSSFHNSS